MDKDSDDGLEEGEIVDYEPLQRPTMPERRTSIAEGELSESEDSDNEFVPKRCKTDNTSKNKYNIWCNELETSDLLDDICKWDTGLTNATLDRSRAVESYYCFPKEDDSERVSLKRRHGQVNFTPRLTRSLDNSNATKAESRCLTALKVNASDTIEEVAQDITIKLCEEKEDLVHKIVKVLGPEKAIDLFERTRKIEEEGGMLVMNGSRRRTPGGVYIQILKKDKTINEEQVHEIFEDERNLHTRHNKTRHKYSHLQDFNQLGNGISPDILDEEGLPLLLRRKQIGESESSTQPSTDNEREPLVKNPPPSPATDGDQLEERTLCSYDDIFYVHDDCDMELI